MRELGPNRLQNNLFFELSVIVHVVHLALYVLRCPRIIIIKLVGNVNFPMMLYKHNVTCMHTSIN